MSGTQTLNKDDSSTSLSGIPDVNRKDDQFAIKVKDNGQETPPADGATKPPEKTPDENVPFHKHPRFVQVTTENRELKSTVSAMQSKLNELQAKMSESETRRNMPAVPSRIDKMVERRVAAGMTETEAKQDVADYLEELEDRINAKLKQEVAPLKQNAEELENQRKVKEMRKKADDMLAGFQQTLKDEGVEWDEKIDKKMDELFKTLTPQWQVSIATDESMSGLRLLYNSAKSEIEKESSLNRNTTGNAGGKGTGSNRSDGKVHASWVRSLSPEEADKNAAMIEQAAREGRYVED